MPEPSRSRSATPSAGWAAFCAATTTAYLPTFPGACAFPEGLPPTTVRVHPTQLYEIAGSLVIFALLVWVFSPRFKREGPLIFVYAVLAGIARLLVEFIRSNEPVALGLTSQQWIAIAMIVVGVVGAWYFGTRGRLRPVIAAKPGPGQGGARQGRQRWRTQEIGGW